MQQNELKFFPIGEYGICAINGASFKTWEEAVNLQTKYQISLPNGEAVYLTYYTAKFTVVAMPAYLDIVAIASGEFNNIQLHFCHHNPALQDIILRARFDILAKQHSLRLFPNGKYEALPQPTTHNEKE